MYQSGRAGDEAKKRKSPAKAGELASLEMLEVPVVNLLYSTWLP